MNHTLHNDGAPRRAYTYPVPTARALDDSERNQLHDLRHEACEDHCTECGCCDWWPTGPMSTRPVPIVNGLCPDCTPEPWPMGHLIIIGTRPNGTHWCGRCDCGGMSAHLESHRLGPITDNLTFGRILAGRDPHTGTLNTNPKETPQQ